ncbi:MAG TPA: penicillin-binding transpeptidase domain-containing protein [Bacillales bacterium]|nr:penicillin-binding transpeptidase domain-containing protein [Bacillales bacterium]
MNRKNTNINKGAALLLIVFMLLFFALIARFGYIQITQSVNGKGLVALAKDRWTTSEKLRAQRGTIYDNKGEVLAESVPAFNVIAVLDKNTEHVKNPEKTASELAPILDMNKSRLLQLLTRDKYEVQLGPGGNRISYEKMRKIKKLHLPGIRFQAKSKRYYPNQKFASYVLGFTSRDAATGELKGDMGVEKSMNKKLTGTPGTMKYMSSPNGVKLPGSSDKKSNPPQNGDNVYLTLDSHIQMFLEHAINKAAKKYDPKRIMAVVMDPHTGAILAMANRPSFNPNQRNISDWTNDIVSDPFEPGSVMKIITLSAAVDAGVYHGHAKYQSGSYQIGGITVHDWKAGGWGKITFNKAVALSSNVGFVKLAQNYIGFDRFYHYLMKFDFKKKTGIALPDEANSNFAYNYLAGKATTAFGQGTAVTAMQLVKATSAVANNGKMMKPYIIKKVVNPNTGKTVFENHPKVAGTPISADSAKKVRQLLRSVVTEGTGTEFALDDYKVTGKTGTAQIPSKNGGYIQGKYIHSFLGMAPANDPQLLVYVAVDRPDVKISYYGSKPVADIFKFTMKHSLQYLNIQPDENMDPSHESSAITLDDVQGKPVDQVKQMLENEGLNVSVLGSGTTVNDQLPLAGEKVLPESRVLLRTSGDVKMPDLSGWSLSNVMKLASLLGLDPKVTGSGFVESQSIAQGQPVKPGQTLEVQLGVPETSTATNQDKSDSSSQK